MNSASCITAVAQSWQVKRRHALRFDHWDARGHMDRSATVARVSRALRGSALPLRVEFRNNNHNSRATNAFQKGMCASMVFPNVAHKNGE